jgi:hypothetical protein
MFPGVQLFFSVVVAIVWFVGFARQRSFGFLLLGFAVLAEPVVSLIRQALMNHYIFHLQESHLDSTQLSKIIGFISIGALAVSILVWILLIMGALLVVLRPASAGQHPVKIGQ